MLILTKDPQSLPVLRSIQSYHSDLEDNISAFLSLDDKTLMFSMIVSGCDNQFVYDLSRCDDDDIVHFSMIAAHLKSYQALQQREEQILFESDSKLAALREENAELKQRLFGTSSEKSKAADAEQAVAQLPEVNQPSGDDKARLPLVRNSGRKPLPASLPRDNVVYDLAEANRQCPCCSGALRPIGVDVSEQITVIPAHFRVRRNILHKYACPACEKVVSEIGAYDVRT